MLFNVGVGVQRIIGRIHMVQVAIESDFLTTSFSVLEEQPMDMLLGLDMLRRHQVHVAYQIIFNRLLCREFLSVIEHLLFFKFTSIYYVYWCQKFQLVSEFIKDQAICGRSSTI